MITKEEMIGCQSWYDMADYHYDGQPDLPSGVIHCDTASIPQCFKTMEKFPSRRYVVISSRCDFGLHYQVDHPPWLDYTKLAAQGIGPSNSSMGYANITLPAPVNRDRCNPYDRYSIKCYRFTEATFQYIPRQVVKWFVANNTVLDDSRIVSIPFGINNVDGNEDAMNKISSRQNRVYNNRESIENDLYVNFAFYTAERLRLYQLYSGDSFATCEQGKSYDQFLDSLEQHDFILCPPGNGWDCYRTLEAIYMGCVPIVEDNAAMRVYARMHAPCIFITSLEAITLEVIKAFRESWFCDRSRWDLSSCKLSYWKQLIYDARRGI